MSSFLFDGVVSQYIDDNGKCRMLNYKLVSGENLSLMTSPLPPLDLPSDKRIIETSLETAVKFIEQRGLMIFEQDGNKDDGIQGLWIETKEENPGIYYGYIPIQVSKCIKDVAFSEPTKNDPLRTDDVSELSTFRMIRKTAEFLQQYTLYTYALDPTKFGEESFIIIPKHQYDIEKLNKRLYKDGNKIMYSKGRLIVPSKEVRDRLLSFLKVQLLNNTAGVESLKDTRTIDVYYQTISDFRSSENQLIFMNKNGVLRWKYELAKQESGFSVSSRPLESNTEPYFYRNPRIKNDQLMIVQNVSKGDLQRALSVARKWQQDRINIGYDAEIDANVDDVSYVLYSETGEIRTVKKKNKEPSHIFEYENKTYSALLFLSNHQPKSKNVC